jgi:hypothetical protein
MNEDELLPWHEVFAEQPVRPPVYSDPTILAFEDLLNPHIAEPILQDLSAFSMAFATSRYPGARPVRARTAHILQAFNPNPAQSIQAIELKYLPDLSEKSYIDPKKPILVLHCPSPLPNSQEFSAFMGELRYFTNTEIRQDAFMILCPLHIYQQFQIDILIDFLTKNKVQDSIITTIQNTIIPSQNAEHNNKVRYFSETLAHFPNNLSDLIPAIAETKYQLLLRTSQELILRTTIASTLKVHFANESFLYTLATHMEKTGRFAWACKAYQAIIDSAKNNSGAITASFYKRLAVEHIQTIKNRQSFLPAYNSTVVTASIRRNIPGQRASIADPKNDFPLGGVEFSRNP